MCVRAGIQTWCVFVCVRACMQLGVRACVHAILYLQGSDDRTSTYQRVGVQIRVDIRNRIGPGRLHTVRVPARGQQSGAADIMGCGDRQPRPPLQPPAVRCPRPGRGWCRRGELFWRYNGCMFKTWIRNLTLFFSLFPLKDLYIILFLQVFQFFSQRFAPALGKNLRMVLRNDFLVFILGLLLTYYISSGFSPEGNLVMRNSPKFMWSLKGSPRRRRNTK